MLEYGLGGCGYGKRRGGGRWEEGDGRREGKDLMQLKRGVRDMSHVVAGDPSTLVVWLDGCMFHVLVGPGS